MRENYVKQWSEKDDALKNKAEMKIEFVKVNEASVKKIINENRTMLKNNYEKIYG